MLIIFNLVLFGSIESLLLSKSSVQICENRGLSGHGDPVDLVNGKSCQKKMIVVMTVKNEQNGTEKLMATVSRVRDDTSSDYARLYNPFLITISKSPVLINYPYFYTGYSVNNKPIEEIRKSEGNWWAIDSSKQCYDQWQPTEKEEMKPTCGYQYSTVQKKQDDGSYVDVKQRIWDSQIIAHYVGDFASVKSYPVLSERYFLIPRVGGLDARKHPQLRDGVSKYLILPMSYVDLQGGACNKVGVSFSSFKNQAAGGIGYGCQQKKGYCLQNQPWHYFKNDVDRLDRDKTPMWFPARYGKLVGTRKPLSNDEENDDINDEVVLSFESQEDHVSLITLQISADDIILIYNRAAGDIVRAAIKDFEALSLDGKLHVEILNKGFVTADFFVAIPVCSKGIGKIQERGASINPQVTKEFVFSLRTSLMEGAAHTCIVQLYDAKRELLAQRNVSFSSSTPCVCEQTACRCECTETGGVKCLTNEGSAFVNPKLFKVKKSSSDIFGSFGSFFSNALSFPFNLFSGIAGLFGSAWTIVQYAFYFIIFLIVFWLFNQCGGVGLIKKMLGKKNHDKFKWSTMKSNVKTKLREKKLKLKNKALATKEKIKEKAEDIKSKTKVTKEKVKGKLGKKRDVEKGGEIAKISSVRKDRSGAGKEENQDISSKKINLIYKGNIKSKSKDMKSDKVNMSKSEKPDFKLKSNPISDRVKMSPPKRPKAMPPARPSPPVDKSTAARPNTQRSMSSSPSRKKSADPSRSHSRRSVSASPHRQKTSQTSRLKSVSAKVTKP